METYTGSGTEQPKQTILDAPRCRKCRARAGQKFYMTPNGLVALTGWCECADQREGAIKFPDWRVVFLGEISTDAEPIPPPPNARVVLRCDVCRGPIVSVYRWLVKSGYKWWSHGCGLCSCGEKKIVAEIEADWQYLVRNVHAIIADVPVGDVLTADINAGPPDAPAQVEFSIIGASNEPPELDDPES